MKILRIGTYRDGGTVSIETDEGQYCINRGMNRTENIDRLFLKHPSEGNLISTEDTVKIKRKLKAALKQFKGTPSKNELDAIKNIKLK